jgi:hypothetical protein
VAIHAKRDDLGLRGDKESLITGNAGELDVMVCVENVNIK